MHLIPRSKLSWFTLLLLLGNAVLAQPAEVQNVTLDAGSNLNWSAVSGADDYNVYRGLINELAVTPPQCFGDEITATSFSVGDTPPPGTGYAFLVTAEDAAGEGTLGDDSGGGGRDSLGACDDIIKHHILSRMGYGWSEWNADRLDQLGNQAYIDEQLAPATITESFELQQRLQFWDPPLDFITPLYRRIDQAVYTRRQFQEILLQFWSNHFNTNYQKTLNYISIEDPIDPTSAARLLNRENQNFREQSLTADFRQILETSALSPSMIVFLDTYSNVAAAPNENYSRELLELYALGVDGGYTEQDVQELARVFTGWTLCKKNQADEDDPLAPCLFAPLALGREWVAHFDPNFHDHGQKVLFAGTPQEVLIPSTSTDPLEGVDDVRIALDAIAAHPSTRRFISTKLLQLLIVDDPPEPMIQNVINTWTVSNGDLLQVTREALEQGILDPRYARVKIRDSLEQALSLYRGMGADLTPGGTSFAWSLIVDMGYNLHLNGIPTGYPETGRDWVGTNTLLERQNSALNLATDPLLYETDISGLVLDNGLSTSQEIVDFFVSTLLGDGISSAQRAALVEYLDTDENGAPSPYDTLRIRQLVGTIAGLAQNMEQ